MHRTLRPFISSHKQSGRVTARVTQAKRGSFVWLSACLCSALILFQTIHNVAARQPASEGKKRWVFMISCLALSSLQKAHARYVALATPGADETRCRRGCPRRSTREPRRVDTPATLTSIHGHSTAWSSEHLRLPVDGPSRLR